jgi:hypothetical protein
MGKNQRKKKKKKHEALKLTIEKQPEVNKAPGRCPGGDPMLFCNTPE